MAVTIPLYGRLADIYGRKRVFFFGTGVFLIGTTLCGFARSIEVLICFRAIQGLGSGAIQPIAMTIIGDIYTPAERARRCRAGSRACSGWPRSSGRRSAPFWCSTCTGRWCSGSICRSASRHHDVRAVPARADRAARAPHRLSRRRAADRRRRLADAGAGSGAQPWAADRIAALVALGAWRSGRRSFGTSGAPPEPMLPFGLWRRRVVALCNLAGFGASATMMAVSALLPTYVQGSWGAARRSPAWSSAPQSVSWMFAAFVAGRLMIRTSYRLTAAIGGASLVIGARDADHARPGEHVGCGRRAAAFIIGHRHGVLQHDLPGRDPGQCRVSRARHRHRLADVHAHASAVGRRGVVRRDPQFRRRPAAAGLGQFGQPHARSGDARTALAPIRSRSSPTRSALAAHDAFLLAVVLAAVTLTATLSLPARLSPIRAGSKRQRAE